MKQLTILLVISLFFFSCSKQENRNDENMDGNDSTAVLNTIAYPEQGTNGTNLLNMEDGAILEYDEYASYCLAANLEEEAQIRLELSTLSKECDQAGDSWETYYPLSGVLRYSASNESLELFTAGHGFESEIVFNNTTSGSLQIQIWENQETTPITKIIEWQPGILDPNNYGFSYGFRNEPSLLDTVYPYNNLNTTDEFSLTLDHAVCSRVYAVFKNVGDSANTWITLSNTHNWDIEYIDPDIKVTPHYSSGAVLLIEVETHASDSLTIESYENGASTPARSLQYAIITE